MTKMTTKQPSNASKGLKENLKQPTKQPSTNENLKENGKPKTKLGYWVASKKTKDRKRQGDGDDAKLAARVKRPPAVKDLLFDGFSCFFSIFSRFLMVFLMLFDGMFLTCFAGFL